MILIFSGCIRDLGTGSSADSKLSSESSLSKANGSSSTTATSSASKTSKSSTGASTNYDDIQKQLDELEDVLNSLDGYSEGDMEIPSS
jgi:hypothetical protein